MDEKKVFFINAIKCALNGKTAECENYSDWNDFCKYTAVQNAWSFAHFALEKSSAPEEVKNLLEQRFASVVGQQVRQEFFQGAIFDKLDENKIEYLPIKGSTLRALYPHPEMRVSCDVDFLVRQEDMPAVREVLKSCGLEQDTSCVGADHDVWHAEGGVTIEPHKSLMSLTDFAGYFTDFWQKTFPVGDGTSRMRLKTEDEYIFLIAHAYKHFIHGGCGVKTLCDVWFFRKKHTDMDEEYVYTELEKIGAAKFDKKIIALADCWLGDAEMDEESEILTDFLFDGGVYGTGKSSALMGTDAESVQKTKRKYLLKRLFPPLKSLKLRYPVLNKCPFLLPVMWIVRIFDAIFTRRGTIKRNLKDCGSMNEQDVEKAKKIKEIIS